MNYHKSFRIGMRVIVSPQHWLRANEVGLVIGRQRDRHRKWLVQFESSHPGGGIDGDRLWLDENDASALEEYEPQDGFITPSYCDPVGSADHVS